MRRELVALLEDVRRSLNQGRNDHLDGSQRARRLLDGVDEELLEGSGAVEENLSLVRKVAEECPLRQPRAFSDLGDRGTVETPLAVQLHRYAFVGVDCPASAAITRELLGWEPTGPSLLEDLEQDHYYRDG